MRPSLPETMAKHHVALEDLAAKAHAIDVRELSKEELESLREKDPFMYYSIPGIRLATLHSKEIDPTDKDALCRNSVRHFSDTTSETSSSNKNWSSGSSSNSSRSNSPSSGTTVRRQTRIAFEAYTCNLEDLVCKDAEEEGDLVGEGDDEWNVLELLEKIAQLRTTTD